MNSLVVFPSPNFLPMTEGHGWPDSEVSQRLALQALHLATFSES